MQILNETFERYSLQELFLSFNGGKDCTVLLHLINSVLRQRNKLLEEKLLCLYMKPKCPFEEIEMFVEQCKEDYDIEVKTCSAGTTKESLQKVCKEREASPSPLLACLMGCRRTDPYCEELNVFDVTNKN